MNTPELNIRDHTQEPKARPNLLKRLLGRTVLRKEVPLMDHPEVTAEGRILLAHLEQFEAALGDNSLASLKSSIKDHTPQNLASDIKFYKHRGWIPGENYPRPLFAELAMEGAADRLVVDYRDPATIIPDIDGMARDI